MASLQAFGNVRTHPTAFQCSYGYPFGNYRPESHRYGYTDTPQHVSMKAITQKTTCTLMKMYRTICFVLVPPTQRFERMVCIDRRVPHSHHQRWLRTRNLRVACKIQLPASIRSDIIKFERLQPHHDAELVTQAAFLQTLIDPVIPRRYVCKPQLVVRVIQSDTVQDAAFARTSPHDMRLITICSWRKINDLVSITNPIHSTNMRCLLELFDTTSLIPPPMNTSHLPRPSFRIFNRYARRINRSRSLLVEKPMPVVFFTYLKITHH